MMLRRNSGVASSGWGVAILSLLLASCGAFGGEEGGDRSPEAQGQRTQFGACVEGDAQGPIRCTHYALRDASQLSTQQRACESRDDSFHTFDWVDECPDGSMSGCEFPDGTAGLQGKVIEWLYFEGGSCRSPSVPLGEKTADDDDMTAGSVMDDPGHGVDDDEENDSGDGRPVNVCATLRGFGASIEAEIEKFADEFTQCEVDADCDLVSAATRCSNGSTYGVEYPINFIHEMAFKDRVRNLEETLCGEVPGDNLLCAEISFDGRTGCRNGRCREL